MNITSMHHAGGGMNGRMNGWIDGWVRLCGAWMRPLHSLTTTSKPALHRREVQTVFGRSPLVLPASLPGGTGKGDQGDGIVWFPNRE